jgi:cell division protein FtsB
MEKTDNTITVDMRKHFSRRLREAANKKLASIKQEYGDLDKHMYDYKDERDTAALLPLILSKEITVADIDISKLINPLKEAIDEIYSPSIDILDLFGSTASAKISKQGKQLLLKHKAALAECAKRENAVEKEIARIEDKLFFGGSGKSLLKLLKEFIAKKF